MKFIYLIINDSSKSKNSFHVQQTSNYILVSYNLLDLFLNQRKNKHLWLHLPRQWPVNSIIEARALRSSREEGKKISLANLFELMRCGAGLVVVGMPQAAGPAPVVGNWREWNLEQFQKSPVLAEGADRWWNGVCSLNRPTHDATLSLSLLHPVASFPLSFSLSNETCTGRMTIGKWYRGFPTATLRYCDDSMALALFRSRLEIEPLPPSRGEARSLENGVTENGMRNGRRLAAAHPWG